MCKKLFVLSFFIMCMTSIGHAHNPQLVTFYIRNYDAIWMIEGSFPQVGLETAMIKYYADTDLQQLSQEAYKKHVIGYVKNHISIKSQNGLIVKLGEGGLKLGNHQTDIRFVLENLPKTAQNLTISIKCLSENNNHQNILKIPSLKKGIHYIMSQENGFTAILEFGNASKNSLTLSTSSQLLEGVLIIAFLLILLIVIFSIQRIKRSTKLLYKEV